MSELPRPFDMPPESAGFDKRGAWVIEHLMVDLAPLTPIQAAAIPGNFGGESRMKSGVQEVHPIAGRGGFGWEQATGSRRVDQENLAKQLGLPLASDELDYRFLLQECRGSEAHALEQLRKTTSLEAAVYTFEVAFERPSDPEGGLAPRVHFAQRALAEYLRQKGMPVPPPPGPTLPPPESPADTLNRQEKEWNKLHPGEPFPTTLPPFVEPAPPALPVPPIQVPPNDTPPGVAVAGGAGITASLAIVLQWIGPVLYLPVMTDPQAGALAVLTIAVGALVFHFKTK